MTIKLGGNKKEINTKHYFLIEKTFSERSSGYVKICESYDEAIEQVPNYADWWCNNGTCTVVEVDSNFKEVNKWRFYNGELR